MVWVVVVVVVVEEEVEVEVWCGGVKSRSVLSLHVITRVVCVYASVCLFFFLSVLFFFF